MKHGDILVICLVVLCNFSTTQSALTINGERCGQKTCNIGDYCSEVDDSCRPCSAICNTSIHNYDATLCTKQCQDYIHDLRYVRKDESSSSGTNDNLRATVQKLSHMVTVTLTLVCFMLIVLAIVLCFQLYRWKLKKNVTLSNLKSKLFKKSEPVPAENKLSNPAATPGQNGKRDLRLEIVHSPAVSDHSPVTATTSISRRPAEDSALDYAYDNHAMSTPTSHNNNAEGNRF